MFRRSSLIGAGVVFGVVVALTVPSLAHHNPEFDRLRKRVTNLTARVQEAETSNTVLQERLDALEPEVAVVAEEVGDLDELLDAIAGLVSDHEAELVNRLRPCRTTKLVSKK